MSNVAKVPMSHVNCKKGPCRCVKFKKRLCRCIGFSGPDPLLSSRHSLKDRQQLSGQTKQWACIPLIQSLILNGISDNQALIESQLFKECNDRNKI